MPLTSADDIAHLLSRVRFVALVGASDRPDRPSYRVMRFLQTHGYRVFPVNPQLAGQEIHGERVYGALGEIEEPIDMVDIFRRPQAALQLGVINQEAAARAEAAGLEVVMDRCPAIDIPRFNIAPVGGY